MGSTGGVIVPWYNEDVPRFEVNTGHTVYPVVVERGILSRVSESIPAKAGKVFVVTTQDVWDYHGALVESGLGGREIHKLIFPGGETHKRFSTVETMAERMVQLGADRSSMVIAFGGGIANDMGGFLAAIFMRGIPVIQIPTTLLSQVDAAVGGKTGVNLLGGKNLIGSFHQPLTVLIDPSVLATLPEREYRAGLYEVVKHGVIASPELFEVMDTKVSDVLEQRPAVVDYMIAESVRIKAEVVSADEKEGGLRRILNFGHTVGHALEAETKYSQFLHGEAVAFGMKAATHLAVNAGVLGASEKDRILSSVERYGPIPPLKGVTAEALAGRLVADKKSIQGKVHFVLPDRIGHTIIRSDIPQTVVLESIRAALA